MDCGESPKTPNSMDHEELRLPQPETETQEPNSLSLDTNKVEDTLSAPVFRAPPPPPPLRHQTLPSASTGQISGQLNAHFRQNSIYNPPAGPSHTRNGSSNSSQGAATKLFGPSLATVESKSPAPPSPQALGYDGHSPSPPMASNANEAHFHSPYLKPLADRSGAYPGSTAYPYHFYQQPQVQYTPFHSNSLPVNYYAPPFLHTHSAMQSHPHPRGFSHPIPLSQPGYHQYFQPSPFPVPPSPSRMGSFHSTVRQSPSPILPTSSPGPSPPPRPPKPPELQSRGDSSTSNPMTPASLPSANDSSLDRHSGSNTANAGSGQSTSAVARAIEGSHTSEHSNRSLDIYFTPPEDTLSSQAFDRGLGVGLSGNQNDAAAVPAMTANSTPIPLENSDRLDNANPQPQDVRNQRLVEQAQPGDSYIPMSSSTTTENDTIAPPPTYEQVLSEPLHAALISPIPRSLSGLNASRRGNRLPQPPQSPPPGFNDPAFENLDHLLHSAVVSTDSHSQQPNLPQGSSSTEPSSISHNSHPTILTSPPTPSPAHSRANSRASPTSFRRHDPPRRFTLPSADSPPKSGSPVSESEDPLSDPIAFQTGSSPFAVATTSDAGVSASSIPKHGGVAPADSKPQFESRRSFSGIWNKKGSAPPTPNSEFGSEELYRPSTDSGKQPNLDKGKQRLNSGLSSSRLSTFFRPSSSHEQPATPSREQTPPVNPGGVDLLGEDARWESMNDQTTGDTGAPDSANVPLSTDLETPINSIPNDIWDGIEFGFRNPVWDAVPIAGPYTDTSKWPESITLYPIGSDPFYIRAPTWRSLLRFLALQSTTRIEPSVEALAVSRTPTIDLRLVVQFVRTPYTPKNTTRDVCLYFTLHCEMPAADTKLGRNVSTTDRTAMETWDTRVLPYGFICGQKSFLMNPTVRPSAQVTAPGLRGTPLRYQDPDGEDSLFVTLPPPFVELPVKLSDVALYLHECLVLSRNQGKVRKQRTPGKNNLEPPSARLKRGHGSSTTLPEDVERASFPTTPSTPGELDYRQVTLLNVPGINRLAKAIKSIYPDEYALGSAKSNPVNSTGDAEQAEPTEVTNFNHHNKTKGARKSGILGAFQRMRSKSSVAKHAVEELAAGPGSSRRDMNAERFELVTPWRQTAE